jgi:hypothetical protein
VRSMEGVLEGKELARRRAALGADLVPTLGTTVGLIMARRGRAQASRWAGGSYVVRTRPRTVASILQDEQRAWCRACSRRAPRRIAHHPRAVSASLAEPRLRTSTAWSPVLIPTRTMTVCQR